MTYIDSEPRNDFNGDGSDPGHSWTRYTEVRMRWLYGDGYFIDRRAETNVDLAAWNRLGRGKAAA